ncbi:GNAT family N-acetyltransferase [Streptococcus caprae]|uniref:GNAT family N-acetyltransferase n=1 Tax=Streptococcus caprae TaxID=1640501 RepID=A0ABV8CUE6_9STRE
MIKAVDGQSISIWSNIASQLWSRTSKELEQAFVNDRFPYEFLYFKNGECLGFISLSIRQDYVEGAKVSPVAFLEGIYVQPSVRRQSIASELIIFAREWARAHGLSQLASNAELDNELSQLFHQRLGFREVSRTVNFITNL